MAQVNIICPFCGTKLKVDERQLGTTGKCSACRKIFPIKPIEELSEASQQNITCTPMPSQGSSTDPAKNNVKSNSKENPVLDFLFFRTMLLPFLIQILSLALSIVLIIAGIFLIISGQFLQGGLLLISPIFLRLFFEGVMILFSIYKTLQEIREHLEEHCENKKG